MTSLVPQRWASGCKPAETRTSPTLASLPRPSAAWSLTSTTSTRPCPRPGRGSQAPGDQRRDLRAPPWPLGGRPPRGASLDGSGLPPGNVALLQDGQPRRVVCPPRRRGALARACRLPQQCREERPCGNRREGHQEDKQPRRRKVHRDRRWRAARGKRPAAPDSPTRPCELCHLTGDNRQGAWRLSREIPPHPSA